MSMTTENSTARSGPVLPPVAPRLRLITANALQPATCETTQPVTLIGSRRDCHLPLNDPEVSKVHCAIVHTGRELIVCDLCSRSGTFVNGQPVRVGTLNPGDTLRVGAIELTIALIGPPDAPSTVPPIHAGAASTRPSPVLMIRGQKVDLAAGPATVGRRRACDIVVDTPDVSFAHALLFAFNDRPAICDLGSRSGTILNNERIHLAWVLDNDQLIIGGETLPVTWPGVTSVMITETPAPPPEDAAVAPSCGAIEVDAAAQTTGEPIADVISADLAARRRALEARARELDRRQAELDTLAMLVGLQSSYTEEVKKQLEQKAADVERAAGEARARLALALKHEQALTSAWQELERWHGTLQARYNSLRSQVTNDLPAPPPSAGLKHLQNAAPVGQLFGAPDAVARPSPGGAIPNA